MRGVTELSAGSLNDHQDGNSNPVIEANQVGLSFAGSYPLTDGSDFTGRVSVGVIALLIVGMGLLYMWTRNVQGGG